MRRVALSCVGLKDRPYQCTKRFLRKRTGSHAGQPNSPVSHKDMDATCRVSDVGGFRTAGMMAAPPTTSLDRIRAEINVMRRELGSEHEYQRLDKSNASDDRLPEMRTPRRTPLHDTTTTLSFNDELLMRLRNFHKPNDVYLKGDDVIQGMHDCHRIVERNVFRDADEVLRRKKRGDTVKLMKLVFPHGLSHQQTESIRVADRLSALVEEEVSALSKRWKADELGPHEDEIRVCAWVNVLDTLQDDELHQLWSFGLVDLSVLEDLLIEPSDMSGEEGTLSQARSIQGTTECERKVDDAAAIEVSADGAVSQTGPAQVLYRVPDLNEEVNDDEITSSHWLRVLDERVRTLQRLRYVHELTIGIHGLTLAGQPSIDIAPVMEKVHRQQFEAISEKELRELEKYEETTHRLPVKMSEGKPEMPVNVSFALLDRALFPSNSFLYAVAQKDDQTKRFLDGLERIKRETLLDPIFQAALKLAHATERETADMHLYGERTKHAAVMANNNNGSSGDDVSLGAEQHHTPSSTTRRNREGPRHGFRGSHARPYHPADRPYFYNNIWNAVPPRGNFNLPAPALSREEKAALRGLRRRRGKGRRYSQ